MPPVIKYALSALAAGAVVFLCTITKSDFTVAGRAIAAAIVAATVFGWCLFLMWLEARRAPSEPYEGETES